MEIVPYHTVCIQTLTQASPCSSQAYIYLGNRVAAIIQLRLSGLGSILADNLHSAALIKWESKVFVSRPVHKRTGAYVLWQWSVAHICDFHTGTAVHVSPAHEYMQSLLLAIAQK